jgi:hypothetical protein
VSDLGQDVVVRLGVSAEVLLDARERRLEDRIAGEHERLDATRHAAVTVAERMDHHEVQVRHPGPDDRVRLVGNVDGPDELADQRRDRLCTWAFKDDLARQVVAAWTAPGRQRPGFLDRS